MAQDATGVPLVLRALGRRAFVSAALGAYVVIHDAECEDQDVEEVDRLATALYDALKGPSLSMINHDDSMLVYQLHDRGELQDEYYSNPALFDDQAVLCSLIRGDTSREVSWTSGGTAVSEGHG